MKNTSTFLKKTNRQFYGDKNIAKDAPVNEGSIELFTVGTYISDAGLKKEYDDRGLEPASLSALLIHDEQHPDFADEKYVGTHWKDKDGKWCFASFDRSGGVRGLRVDRDGSGWGGRWWFAGVRKSSDLKT